MPPAYHDRTRSKSKKREREGGEEKRKEGCAKVKRGVVWEEGLRVA